MTEKELRKLKRAELLEMLIEQGKTMAVLREELEVANKKLTDRRIALEEAGNIAEASLQINGVFVAAHAAAQHYLENIQRLSEQQESICKERESKSIAQCEEREKQVTAQCEEMERNCRAKCEEMERETKEKCEAMTKEAEKKVEENWLELSNRLQNFYKDHQDLQKLLNVANGTKLGE